MARIKFHSEIADMDEKLTRTSNLLKEKDELIRGLIAANKKLIEENTRLLSNGKAYRVVPKVYKTANPDSPFHSIAYALERCYATGDGLTLEWSNVGRFSTKTEAENAMKTLEDFDNLTQGK